jgi:hypothetical protein
MVQSSRSCNFAIKRTLQTGADRDGATPQLREPLAGTGRGIRSRAAAATVAVEFRTSGIRAWSGRCRSDGRSESARRCRNSIVRNRRLPDEVLHAPTATSSIGCAYRRGEGISGDTIHCRFRHPLQRNTLGTTLLKAVDEHLRRSDCDPILALAGHVANALEHPDLLHRNESHARRSWVAGENEGTFVDAPSCDCADNGTPLCVVVESMGRIARPACDGRVTARS